LVNVFGARSLTIARELELSAEENFTEALKMAAVKDSELQEALKNGQDAVDKLGLLHGIPISVKDSLHLKGFLSTIGCAYLATDDRRATENCVFVQFFINAGAIPLVRGSTP
jgi:Asp-tRNA(Asn)/Glu-tRNA(Gln) amidotransferase A subunit family amidase